MQTDEAATRGADDGAPSDEELSAFLDLLSELKATGCTLLVVGDAPRDAFTRASSRLLGDAEALRYRVLAVTDATPGSVADRLPDPSATPRPLSATTRVLNHVGAPRSVTAARPDAPSELTGIEEVRIADPDLEGLRSGLVDAVEDAARSADGLRPADLRVGVDSLDPLLERYADDVVRECLDAVGERAREYDAITHYVLTDSYDGDRVRSLVPSADAVIELRAVDSDEYGHATQQRWHVPRRDIRTEWTPL